MSACAAVALLVAAGSATAAAAPSKSPPQPAGYFSLQQAGAWSRLPGDAACAARVHRSAWEPRPDNARPNHPMPPSGRARRVRRDARSRPPAATRTDGTPGCCRRVDGHYTGTTDEIFQWAACKWGLRDNLLRAIAVRESTWYQYEVYPSVGASTTAAAATRSPPRAPRAPCTQHARPVGYDYQRDYGAGRCPQTFSIVGVMSWEAPSWGPMPGNQNGTFPFNRDSTAFAVDYLGAQLRGCYEGWERWLASDYRRRHLGLRRRVVLR